jgi:predicted transglutaminase-like cysteine proteinase
VQIAGHPPESIAAAWEMLESQAFETHCRRTPNECPATECITSKIKLQNYGGALDRLGWRIAIGVQIAGHPPESIAAAWKMLESQAFETHCRRTPNECPATERITSKIKLPNYGGALDRLGWGIAIRVPVAGHPPGSKAAAWEMLESQLFETHCRRTPNEVPRRGKAGS